MSNIVHVEGLRKTYGETIAVDHVSFEVHEGEIFGMVGPNGAGKTTTIECLEGLRKPDQGTIRVLGVDPQRESHILRERTGIQLFLREPASAFFTLVFPLIYLLLLSFILSSLSFFGIGFILAGIMPTVRTAWVASMVLVYPMLLLSSAFFSIEVLPAVVQKVSAFIPLTYVVNLLRGLWYGEPWGNYLLEVGVLIGMLLLGVVVSAKTFRWE